MFNIVPSQPDRQASTHFLIFEKQHKCICCLVFMLCLPSYFGNYWWLLLYFLEKLCDNPVAIKAHHWPSLRMNEPWSWGPVECWVMTATVLTVRVWYLAFAVCHAECRLYIFYTSVDFWSQKFKYEFHT